jgi:hypothetical protein
MFRDHPKVAEDLLADIPRLERVAEWVGAQTTADAVSVTINQLKVGMRFVRDVKATSGVTLVRKGDRVTDALRARLQNFKSYVGVIEPLRVIPVKDTI